MMYPMMHNDVQRNLPLPEEATMVGHTDDTALVVVGKDIQDAELYSGEEIGAVKGCLKSSSLTLMEAVFITKP